MYDVEARQRLLTEIFPVLEEMIAEDAFVQGVFLFIDKRKGPMTITLAPPGVVPHFLIGMAEQWKHAALHGDTGKPIDSSKPPF